MKPENISPNKNESQQFSQNTPENAETQQSNIAHEYLRKYEDWKVLSAASMDALKNLDSARDEQHLSKNSGEIIPKLEEECKKLSELVDGAQSYMNQLFEQLTDESKEKYLTTKEEISQKHE